MSEVFIRAIERTDKPKKARRDGFTPGVIYGLGLEAPVSVKFELNKLKRFFKNHYKNSITKVKYGEKFIDCIVKEIQKDPITGNIIHIDLQSVSQSNLVKVKAPVVFSGRNFLEEKRLLLHIFMSELQLSGKLEKIPEIITISVANKKSGDKIMVKDIQLDQDIRKLDNANEIIAVIAAPKELEAAS